MIGGDEQKAWMALMAVDTVKSIRDGDRTFSEQSSRFKGDAFDVICSGLLVAHDMGLSRLREVLKDRTGRVVQIVFEMRLTPAGEAFIKGGPPKMSIDPERSASLRAHLERQAATGDGTGPMIDGNGEVVGRQSDFMTREQIMANAREQLRILDEEEKASRA